MSAPAFNAAGLTDAVLEAASSKGLLRRARRDRAAGLARFVATEDGAHLLAVDGEKVRLEPSGLGGATCTCPARETCRHVLAAVLELRDGGVASPPEDAGAAPSSLLGAAPPADAVDDILSLSAAALVEAFGRAVLKRAELILAEAIVPGDESGAIAVEGGPGSCVIRIPGQPDVHYLAGLGPGGMVSKATGDAAKALHAAALLALRRLRAGEAVATPGAEPAPDAPRTAPKAEAAFLGEVAEALREAARSALASAPEVLEERLLDLAVSSRADAMPNLAGSLRAIAGDIGQRRRRAALFDSRDALEAVARAYALVEALRRDGGDPRLRGVLRDTYAAEATLALIGCGVTLWRSAAGARGATAHFLGPDTQGGPRWFSMTLARAAGQDPAFTPSHAATSEPVWGEVMARLGRDVFHLDDARIGTDGRLSPTPTSRARVSPEPWRVAIARYPDVVVADWSAIPRRVRPGALPTLRQQPGAAQPLLLAPTAVGPVRFDALSQEASVPVQDREGRWLELRIAAETDVDRRADAIAAAGPAQVLVVVARVEGAEFVLSPIAVAPDGNGPLDHLDLPSRGPKPPEARPSALQRGLGILDRLGLRREAKAPRFVRPATGADATARLLASAADETLALAELGGWMEDADRSKRIAILAERLDTGGLGVLAQPLARLAIAPIVDRPHHLMVFTHTLACYRRLSPRLPWLVQVS